MPTCGRRRQLLKSESFSPKYLKKKYVQINIKFLKYILSSLILKSLSKKLKCVNKKIIFKF
jgi:hypothetical protein